ARREGRNRHGQVVLAEQAQRQQLGRVLVRVAQPGIKNCFAILVRIRISRASRFEPNSVNSWAKLWPSFKLYPEFLALRARSESEINKDASISIL
ncbi:hypothetical protein AB0O03_28805, partial [Streptomyces diastaticus]|uniref:hypothetical protein n=1 Tax=Streptomyces diastaticus TaxID=1956 RepID=UPI003414968C